MGPRDGHNLAPSLGFKAPGSLGLNKLPPIGSGMGSVEEARILRAVKGGAGGSRGLSQLPTMGARPAEDVVGMLPPPVGAPRRKGVVDLPEVDEVGKQMRPDPTAKDPYARSVKEPGKLLPLQSGRPSVKASQEEVIVKGQLAPFMDPHSRIVMQDPEVLSVLRQLDKKKDGAARFSAVLRTLRGSDPQFVNQALEQMPQARRAWEWTLAGGSEKYASKFDKNEDWLMTTQLDTKTPEYRLAKQAHQHALDAYRRGDLMGADLASSAVYSIQQGEVDRARHQMAQAKAWQKEKPLSEEWLRTFNPRAVERAESQGKRLAPVLGGGLDETPDFGQDEDRRGITKMVPVEENRPGIARMNFHGQMEAEDLPPIKYEGKARVGKGPSPDWFKVMRAHREIENDLIQKGMPRKLAGTQGATKWAAENAPVEVAELHSLMQGIKAGLRADELLLTTSPSKATSILELLLDEGVPPPRGEQWVKPPMQAIKQGPGGIGVNRVPDDLPLLPKMAARVAKTEAIPLAEQALDPRVLEWMAAKLPKPLGKLAQAILRGV